MALTGTTDFASPALRPIVSIDLSSSEYEVVIDGENTKNENTKFKLLKEEEIGDEIDRITFDYNDYVGAYVTGYTPTTKAEGDPCTIGIAASGHTTAQDFTTETDMQWRIWDYNKSTNTIRLISSKPTTQTLTLSGEKGYNNGVWAINEICRECYTMNDIPGISVANLRRTDIQKVSTYDYTKYKHEADNWQEVTDEGDATEGTIQFGATKTYPTNHSYPIMWRDHDQNWTYDKDNQTGDKECAIWEKENEGTGTMTGTEEGEASTTFKQSYYAHDYKDKEKEFIKNKYYDLLFKNEDDESYLEKVYWLAGRWVHLRSDHCDFGMQNVDARSSICVVWGNNLYDSNR